MEKVKAGLIGCGRMGAFSSENVLKYAPKSWFPLSHIEALKANKQFYIEGICDKNTSSLDKAKEKYSIKYCYEDYLELLENHDLNLLCVATRTKGRANIIKDAVKYGTFRFHIEKPLCNSTKEFFELEELCLKNNVELTFGTIRRYMPIYNRARELVNSGEYGLLQQIDINFANSALYWTHPHSVDLGLFFANDELPSKVQATLSNLKSEIVDNEYIIDSDPFIETATMFFDNNVTCRIGRGGNFDVILHCEKGEIIIEADGARLLARKSKQENQYLEYPFTVFEIKHSSPQGSFLALNMHLESINKKITIDSSHIFNCQRVLFSILESHIKNGFLASPSSIEHSIVINARTGDLYA